MKTESFILFLITLIIVSPKSKIDLFTALVLL